VVAVEPRALRPYAAPAAFLAAVTLAIAGARVLWPHHAARRPPAPQRQAAARQAAKAHSAARYYRVRAGDTLAGIAARTHTPLARLQRLNPTVQPTALFIGQKLRLR
jgi:Tfp pilus assembly protein FimV